MKNKFLFVIAVPMMFVFGLSLLAGDVSSFVDIPGLMIAADFVFKGTVINVQYKNSQFTPLLDEFGNPVLDEYGNQAYADGSDIPHAFVTYQVEQVYKGPRTPPTQITLRIEGGESDNPDPNEKRWLYIEPYPIFNVGDRDIIFLEGNTLDPCPLARCQQGRFRIFADLNFPNQNFIFSDMGLEIRAVMAGGLVRDWQIVYGPQHIRPEVIIRTIGQEQIEFILVNPTEGVIPPPEDNPQGVSFDEASFDTYLTDLVGELFTPEELLLLPPPDSADINQNFQGHAFMEVADPVAWPPNPCDPLISCEPSRPWLDEVLTPEELDELLEAERQEREWLTLSGGNPVLPQTPCEEAILRYGTMPGDISGPEGRPDCCVNIHDFAVLAADWLKCENP